MVDVFALSFRPDISLTDTGEQLILQSPQHCLKLDQPKPGLKAALEHLKHSALTPTQLIATVADLDGAEEGLIFGTELQKLIHLGWICHAVLPLAIAIPIAEPYHLDDSIVHWQQHPLSLSRFAFLHQEDQHFILESPLSKAKIQLLDWRAPALIAKLAAAVTPLSLDDLAETLIEPEIAQRFVQLLIATQMVTLEPDPPAIDQWQFHNLLFHRQTRLDRLADQHTSEPPSFEDHDRYPIVKPPMSDQVIPLNKPDLLLLTTTDISLTQAIETRQSIRHYSDRPISINQLGEFLYRCARVKEVHTLAEDWLNLGECTKRPYPAGGALYELEIYPVINYCQGLAAGLYHYQPLAHALHRVSAWNPEVEALLYDAWNATGQQDSPQVLLIITARFGRLFWKYHAIGYGLILKHVGVLYQTFYLVATAMHLAPCAIGAGNSEKFCTLAGLNEYEESSVGEFALGSVKD